MRLKYTTHRSLFLLIATTYGTAVAQALNGSTQSYVLPMYDAASTQRQQQVAENQQGYLYGQPL